MKEIEELRGSILALTALLHAVVETHPDPAALRERFLDLCEQAMATLLVAGSDEQTQVAEAAFDAMRAWLGELQAKGRSD